LAENLCANQSNTGKGTDEMAAYTRDDVEKIAEALRSLPAATKNKLSKQGVVAHLAAEILGLQERGYTIEQIAESLRGLGLIITTKTLSKRMRIAKAPGFVHEFVEREAIGDLEAIYELAKYSDDNPEEAPRVITDYKARWPPSGAAEGGAATSGRRSRNERHARP
jgi:hypothetical protein